MYGVHNGVAWRECYAEVFSGYLENKHPCMRCMGCLGGLAWWECILRSSPDIWKNIHPCMKMRRCMGCTTVWLGGNAIPRYSPGIWNSQSVSYPHFPSGKPVWPHIAQFQNRDKDDQNGNSSKHNSQCQPSWSWNMTLDWSYKLVIFASLDFWEVVRQRQSQREKGVLVPLASWNGLVALF